MVTSGVTLEQVEREVTQLPVHEQIKLIARISERLSALPLAVLTSAEESAQAERLTQMEAFLKMSEEMAAETVGAVDSAEDIRQIREERASWL